MAIGNWWIKVRHCLVWHDEADTPPGGARDANRQTAWADWVRTDPFATAEQPSPLPTPIPRDQIGSLGLAEWEAETLADWVGADRLRELHGWVNRAHKRLELLHFPNHPGGASIAMLRDVHPEAVRELARLLRSVVGVKELSVEQVRSLFHRRLPGLTFPSAADKAELEELIAVARNLNWWLADRGRLACGCPPLVMEAI